MLLNTWIAHKRSVIVYFKVSRLEMFILLIFWFWLFKTRETARIGNLKIKGSSLFCCYFLSSYLCFKYSEISKRIFLPIFYHGRTVLMQYRICENLKLRSIIILSLKAHWQISKNSVSKSIVNVIKHANL